MTRIIKPARFFISISLIILILTFGGYKLYQVGKNLLGYRNSSFEKISTITLKNDNGEKKQQIVIPFKGDIVVYYNNSLKAYTIKGEEKWSLGQMIEKPILKSSENLLFLVDKNTGFINAIDDQGTILWTVDAQPIEAFVCNEKGNAVLVREEETGGGEITVLDTKGQSIGKIGIMKGTIMDTVITEDGEMIAVSLLSTENNNMETNIVLYSKEGKLLGGNKYDDEIMANMFFSDDNRLISVGTDRIVCFDKGKGLLWSKELPNSINKLAWNGENIITLNLVNSRKSIIDTKSQNYISMLDIEGEKLFEVPMKENIQGMTASKDNVIAFGSRTMYYLKSHGQKSIEKKITNDIKGVYFISDNQLIVVTEGKLEIMQLN